MKNTQSYKIPIIISVIFHALLFSLLFVHFSAPKPPPPTNTKMINAIAVTQSQLSRASNPVNITKSVTPSPSIDPLPQNMIQHIEQVALKQPEITKIENVKKPQPKEVAPEEESQSYELQEPKIDEKIALKKIQDEKKKAERAKKEEQKKLAKKRQEEEAKHMQKELASEAKQMDEKVEVAVKSSAPQETDSNMDEQLNKEKEELQASQAAQAAAGEVDRYKQMIVQTISRKWLIPDTENTELACQLLVHLGPGGVVLSVDVLKESGDENLDRSARNAIMKASPLPVPDNTELFDNFRALRLTFRPQGIISG